MATLRFKMLPDEAKDKKQHLRVAVYGFPVATPEKYDYKHVYFIPTKFIVFNNLTGTIYEETSDEIFQSFCETP